MGVNKNQETQCTISREVWMLVRRAARLLGGLTAALAALGMAASAHAQEKKIKIGVIYDLTGPFAGGGSELQYIGAKIMLDQYAKTGVEGYKVEAVYADAQSKPDVAINEAVRLIEQEKVDMLLGFFSSAQCVPVAARVEQLKKFMWITTCISSGVLENKNYKYIFRPQASGDQFGLMTTDFIAQNAKEKFGKEPKDMRVAIIHEDGAYGVDVAKGNEAGAKKAGFNIVLKEGYSATELDLACEPGSHGCQVTADHQDGRRGVRQAEAGHGYPVGSRRHGRFEHLRIPDRSAAARDQEIRWRRSRRAAQGGAGSRPSRRRHHAGLRRQILRRRHPNGRTERTLIPGRYPVRRRQVLCGMAEEPGATRGCAAAAGWHDL